jgi:hypothetical protein
MPRRQMPFMERILARDVTGSPAAPLWFAGALLILATFMLLQCRLLYGRPSHPASA